MKDDGHFLVRRRTRSVRTQCGGEHMGDPWLYFTQARGEALHEMILLDPSIILGNVKSTILETDDEKLQSLVRTLVDCSINQFDKYIRICNIVRSRSKSSRTTPSRMSSPPPLGMMLYHSHDAWYDDVGQSVWKAAQVETSSRLAHQPSYVSAPISASNCVPNTGQDFVSPEKGGLELWQRVHKLPAETYLRIMEYFFQVTIGPRKMYPQSERMDLHVLRALNRELYANKLNTLWSRNTWVLGEGPRHTPRRFLNLISTNAFSMTKRLELHFTLQNEDGLPLSLDHYFREERNDTNPYSTSDVIQCFRWETWARVVEQAEAAWKLNFRPVTQLRLEYLLLDFTKAYAPDETYFGLRLARTTRSMKFEHGQPADFRVAAPTQDLEATIRGMIVRRNRIQ